MLDLFRAFAWLRWRLVMNGFVRTSRRDRLQRLSLALESLGPILAALLLGPALLAAAGVGLLAGWMLGSGDARAAIVLTVLRFVALASLVMALAAPLLSAGGRHPADLVRLLLLPIPRRALYASELAAALADPWVLVTVPVFLLLPVGSVLAGRPGAALAAAAAGGLFLLVLSGFSLFGTTLTQLLLRRRRVAELLGIILAFVPLVFALPGMLDREARRADRPGPPVRAERSSQPTRALVEPADGWLALVPSELYTAAVAQAPAQPRAAALALVGLLVGAAAAQTLSWCAYRRLLASPASGTSGERHRAVRLWSQRLPGLSPGASAVATATIRLVLRTPRGRVILLTPLALAAFFAVPVAATGRGLAIGSATVDPGFGLALAVALLSLVAAGPVALNQFAIDGPALSLQMLAPVADRDLVAGKAVAVGLVSGVPTLAGLATAAAIVPPTSLASWLGLVAAVLGTLGLLAPIWSMLSAAFPRTATLASLKSSASNPHSAAHFIGLGALAGSVAPPATLAAFAVGLLDRAALVPSLLALWAVVACLVGRALFGPATALFRRRREPLALVAQGRG